MNSHVKANPNTATGRSATSESATRAGGRNPMAKPIAVVTAAPHPTSTVSASARPASRRAGDRQRPQAVDDAALDVLGQPRRRRSREQHAGTTKPGTRKST